MIRFNRELPGIEHLLAKDRADCAIWLEHLLMKWRPAGQESGLDGLRLAIRNGYLNFYRCGQSVARVSLEKKPSAAIHIKYIVETAKEQHYAELTDASTLKCRGYDALESYAGIKTLEGWIKRAQDHSGKEKQFVDDVLAYNPNVIDLEMGLPASAKGDTAPRMDIVALESHDGEYRIIFWEAKVMGDGRLRRDDPTELPEVVTQLENYRIWVERDGHRETIGRAYKRNCEILATLYQRARDINPGIGKLGDAIVAVAEARKIPDVDSRPRLLIYDPECSKSWPSHERKLADAGIRIHYVRNKSEDATLPVFP